MKIYSFLLAFLSVTLYLHAIFVLGFLLIVNCRFWIYKQPYYELQSD